MSNVSRYPRNVGNNVEEAILHLWQSGKDTYEIGLILPLPEHEVERRLHRALDRSRA